MEEIRMWKKGSSMVPVVIVLSVNLFRKMKLFTMINYFETLDLAFRTNDCQLIATAASVILIF